MNKFLFITIIIALAAVILTACGDAQDEAVPGYDMQAVQAQPGQTGQATPEPQETATDTNAAAGGDSDASSSETDDDAMKDNEPPTAPYFTFQMRDVIIEMDQKITYVIERFGEPLGVFEQPSCAFDGIDRIFAFPGVQIYTYPKGDADHIHTISLRDDSVRSLEGGIRLGSSFNAVLEAYGDDYVHDSGMYTFTRGLTTLEFLVQDGVVISITYGFIID